MPKIIQNLGKVAAMGIQSVIICEITNVWLFNDKKNIINENIEKGTIYSLDEFREWHWPNQYMQNQFLSSVYGNLITY